MKTPGRTHILFRKLTLTLVTLCLVFSSCVENSGLKDKRARNGNKLSSEDSGVPVDKLPSDTLMSTKVELSHFVDPFDGTYKKKVSIPKNYKGNLYIAGLNVSALQGKLIKVRLNFGIDGQSVVLDATVARAPGIIPQTDIQVLVVDMNSRPFSKMVLGYDLYDYNTYVAGSEPVTDPRDSGLYCRGLKLEDDPTYDKTLESNLECNKADDRCLYAYAKVTDATLYNSNLTTIPSLPQVWTLSNSVRYPTLSNSLTSMCLPDSDNPDELSQLFSIPQSLSYKGPYRAINTDGWKIESDAIFNSKTGLFGKKYFDTNGFDSFKGSRSLMFPIAGKLSLNQGVSYLGSDTYDGVRTIHDVSSTGISKYVDGCNIRVQNYNPSTAEGINSCNVNGSIEIFYKNATGVEVSITTDRAIKIQLLRPSEKNSEGNEVLTGAFKRCDSSSACGSNECCFNSRCWSKDIVSQCKDQTPVIGNQPVGFSCVSDYECSSLCCNTSTGSCAPHTRTGPAPILCNKSAGQRCVAREFCRPEFVATCKLVKLPGLSATGKPQCTLRCPSVETYGECTAGYCVPPAIPLVPTFDPENPDCRNAVDP